jgi:hypothetical protein
VLWLRLLEEATNTDWFRLSAAVGLDLEKLELRALFIIGLPPNTLDGIFGASVWVLLSLN